MLPLIGLIALAGQGQSFPIAVWLQSPANAEKYKAIGINLYVGLWQGPTEDQLAELEKAGMPVICEMNDWAKSHLDRKIITGWMHEDEPDNAQPLPEGKGYEPPIATEKIVQEYRDFKRTDPRRPVLLNLGQGVAWDDWFGRGVRTHHPEDYAEYVKGSDIASFDIYPVTSPPPVKGKLSYVGEGTKRLKSWCVNGQQVWACIEATHISNPDVKPTSEQIRSLVWMAIIHGAKGLIYFSHQFKPSFIEAGILADPETAAAVKKINAEVQSLAPALTGATAKTIDKVDLLEARDGKKRYIFAVSMSDRPVTVRFSAAKASLANVVGEAQSKPVVAGGFQDSFSPYAVHLYQLEPGGR